MNVHPRPETFARAAPVKIDIELEQSVLAHCLADPDLIDVLSDRIGPNDFQEPLHAYTASEMIRLRQDGRSPSVQALISVIGDRNVVDDLTLSEYFKRLMRAAIDVSLTPWTDAIETFVESARRRDVSRIASALSSGSVQAGISVRDLIDHAVTSLDDVASGLRQVKTRRYSAIEAADAAIKRANGAAQQWPTTGLDDLDDMIGGWPRGQLSIVAGRPGMGKSALATSCVLRGARKGHATAFFSLEMTDEQLGARLLTDLAFTSHDPIHYEQILNGRSMDDRTARRLDDARRMLIDLPLMIEEQRGLTVSEIVAKSRKIANEFDRAGQRLETIFVDHMLLVRPSGRYAGSHEREVAEVAENLAVLASDLDCSVVALCQLNRGVEGRDSKRPGLADLRASGAIEEIASVVMFAYRACYYLERKKEDDDEKESKRMELIERLQNSLELIVSKNRNGRAGTVNAFVDIGANAIRNKAFGGR